MSKKDEAYKPFENIKARLEEVAASLGLECHNIAFTVGPHATLQVFWTLKADAVMTDAEKDQRRVDDEFARMMGGFEDPLQDKVKDAKDSLREILGLDKE